MADENINSLTETTTTGWFSRMGSSFIGALIGIVLLPAAIFVLSWNEGRAVTAATGLKRGLSTIVEISADAVSWAGDGNLRLKSHTEYIGSERTAA